MVAESYSKNTVQEYKRTCNQCGKVWHSLVSRENQIKKDISTNNCLQGAFACSNVGAATQAKRNVEAQQESINKLKQCPQCGSSDYNEKIITYAKK